MYCINQNSEAQLNVYSKILLQHISSKLLVLPHPKSTSMELYRSTEWEDQQTSSITSELLLQPNPL